ncbi:MAG: CoA pyrophosphatase [Bryobacteraceae bacterium]|nr:CoA pyrophosphatase [Bryobacteraceae bacterium]MDW8379665.1 CoA pyrophosphatase [Bryobacterales bacterium]
MPTVSHAAPWSQDGSAAPAAAVAVVHAQGPEESVLLIQRARRRNDPWSGQWSFPGGKRDPQDRDLLETALRELQEECELRLLRDQCVATLEVMYAGRSAGRLVAVEPYLFRLPKAVSIQVNPAEATQALWLPLSILRDPSRHQLLEGPGIPSGWRVPGIPLGEVPLWGFTYRVLCAWLGIPILNQVSS